jgi:hypothetical protein
MPRQIDTATLDGAAAYYAGLYMQDAGRFDRAWVMGQFHAFDFKDEFDYLTEGVRGHLGSIPLADFDMRMNKLRKDTPRDDAVFHALLGERLAVGPDGDHLDGCIGKVQVGSRLIGLHDIEVETLESIRLRKALGLPKTRRQTHLKRVPQYWPIYAGEGEERAAGSNAPDVLPPGTPPLPVGAQVMNVSAEVAILALDAMLDGLDEGTGAAVIQGRSGAQPADPDAAVTGTLGFTLVMSDPAFAGAADQADGTVQAAASSITDDASADATITLGYCRVSATNDGATPLDDHIDGEAGTSGADFNFNTLSIVSGATISMSAYTITQSQGSTAS